MALPHRVRKATEVISELKEQVTEQDKEINQLQATNTKLTLRVRELVKALDFYADHRNYHTYGDAYPGQGVSGSVVTKDSGKKAREALTAMEEGE